MNRFVARHLLDWPEPLAWPHGHCYQAPFPLLCFCRIVLPNTVSQELVAAFPVAHISFVFPFPFLLCVSYTNRLDFLDLVLIISTFTTT